MSYPDLGQGAFECSVLIVMNSGTSTKLSFRVHNDTITQIYILFYVSGSFYGI